MNFVKWTHSTSDWSAYTNFVKFLSHFFTFLQNPPKLEKLRSKNTFLEGKKMLLFFCIHDFLDNFAKMPKNFTKSTFFCQNLHFFMWFGFCTSIFSQNVDIFILVVFSWHFFGYCNSIFHQKVVFFGQNFTKSTFVLSNLHWSFHIKFYKIIFYIFFSVVFLWIL